MKQPFLMEIYTPYSPIKTLKKKNAIIATVKETKAKAVIKTLHKTPLKQREKAKEVTLDIAGNMGLIVKKAFPNATLVIDRFHVQKISFRCIAGN